MRLFRFTSNRMVTNENAGEMPDRVKDWLATQPAHGEVFVDTGLASAADVRKLQMGFNDDTERRSLANYRQMAEEDRAELEWRNLNPEAAAAKDLAMNRTMHQLMTSVGLEPERFGVFLPEAE